MFLPMPSLIGHRGLPILAPENTRASLESAAEHNISWVEIDVTMAGDGSLVIMHDLTLKRFGQSDIALVDIDESMLRKVDAGSWFNEAFQGEPLLFLNELLDLVLQLNLSMNLEIKINPALDTETQVSSVIDAIRTHELPLDRLVLSSFNLDALRIAQQQYSELKRAILYEAVPNEWEQDVDSLEPVSVNCDQNVLTETIAADVAKRIPLYCFTVNDTATFQRLLAWGVSGVFCDRAHAEDMRALVSPK